MSPGRPTTAQQPFASRRLRAGYAHVVARAWGAATNSYATGIAARPIDRRQPTVPAARPCGSCRSGWRGAAPGESSAASPKSRKCRHQRVLTGAGMPGIERHGRGHRLAAVLVGHTELGDLGDRVVALADGRAAAIRPGCRSALESPLRTARRRESRLRPRPDHRCVTHEGAAHGTCTGAPPTCAADASPQSPVVCGACRSAVRAFGSRQRRAPETLVTSATATSSTSP
jgi:hypothetical protein